MKILARGWQSFVDVKEQSNISMALEFLANLPERVNWTIRLRRKNVLVTREEINLIYGMRNYSEEQEELIQEEEKVMNMVHFAEAVEFHGYMLHDSRAMQRCELNIVAMA